MPPGSAPPAPGPQPVPAMPYLPGPVPPGALAVPVPGRRSRGWSGIAALVLAVILLPVVGVQAFWISTLQDRLARADNRISAGQEADQSRLDTLDKRTGELEKQLGSAFDSAEIAAAVLPSVFRVVAGDYSGTAFAVGRHTSAGRAYLLTNFHVVEQAYDRGERQVTIERKGQRFPARISRVDEAHDLALLEAERRLTSLATATARVRSGEPVVVVGAPLGLEDSVTTGVVSAFRQLREAPGEVFQFSAPINPGNSGGPVINSAKQVVGIATLKASNAEGIGLAVPIAVACASLDIC